jgi:hypothetical protein
MRLRRSTTLARSNVELGEKRYREKKGGGYRIGDGRGKGTVIRIPNSVVKKLGRLRMYQNGLPSRWAAAPRSHGKVACWQALVLRRDREECKST